MVTFGAPAPMEPVPATGPRVKAQSPADVNNIQYMQEFSPEFSVLR